MIIKHNNYPLSDHKYNGCVKLLAVGVTLSHIPGVYNKTIYPTTTSSFPPLYKSSSSSPYTSILPVVNGFPSFQFNIRPHDNVNKYHIFKISYITPYEKSNLHAYQAMIVRGWFNIAPGFWAT